MTLKWGTSHVGTKLLPVLPSYLHPSIIHPIGGAKVRFSDKLLFIKTTTPIYMPHRLQICTIEQFTQANELE